jgi:hypothetical protein
MRLTTSYFEMGAVMAPVSSDPLCQLLAAEEAWDEIDELISNELAWSHVSKSSEYSDD